MGDTTMARPGVNTANWFLLDVGGQVLGRVATQIAHVLQGKHKPQFCPDADWGDYVVIINADKIQVTGNKEEDKVYYRHSGYPGGLKHRTFKELQAKDGTEALRLAVKRMLPRGPRGNQIFKKCKFYEGAEHPHQAQNLQAWQWPLSNHKAESKEG